MSLEIFRSGVEVRTMIEFEKDNSRLTPRLTSNVEMKEKSLYRATVYQQFEAVLWRSWLTVIKNPRLVQTRIIQAVVTALVLGIVFIGQDYHTQEGAMNVDGAILLMLIQMSYNTAFAVVEVIKSQSSLLLDISNIILLGVLLGNSCFPARKI